MEATKVGALCDTLTFWPFALPYPTATFERPGSGSELVRSSSDLLVGSAALTEGYGSVGRSDSDYTAISFRSVSA